MPVKKRFIEIDLWRGLAVLAMIIFHFFYILDFYNLGNYNPNQGWLFLFGTFARFSFITLVGMGLFLSRQRASSKKKFYLKQIQRSGVILTAALTVSLVTYFYVPDQYVKFGILHLIAFGILLTMYFADKSKLSLVLAIASAVFGHFLQLKLMSNLLAFVIGFTAPKFQSLDYFPIFPWLALIFLGIFLGHLLYRNNTQRFAILSQPKRLITWLVFLGRHSLLIYMVHIPIILLIIWI